MFLYKKIILNCQQFSSMRLFIFSLKNLDRNPQRGGFSDKYIGNFLDPLNYLYITTYKQSLSTISNMDRQLLRQKLVKKSQSWKHRHRCFCCLQDKTWIKMPKWTILEISFLWKPVFLFSVLILSRWKFDVIIDDPYLKKVEGLKMSWSLN